MSAPAQTPAVTPSRSSARHQGVRARVAHALSLVRRIIGVPDYDTYVGHMAARHPGQPLLTESEFAEERLTAKYSKPGQRCC